MPYTTHYNRPKQFIDGNWKVPAACSSERVTYPFEGDLKSYMINQDFMVYSDYYLETVPTQGTPHPSYSGMYFIKDSPVTDTGGGTVKFTRTWGILPGFVKDAMGNTSTVRKESESFVWTKPGINTVGLAFLVWSIDQSAITYPTTDTVTLYTTEKTAGNRFSHDINSNYTTATVQYMVQDSQSNLWQALTYTTTIISKTSNSITIARAPYSNPSGTTSISYNWFSRPQIAHKPIQRVVNSIVHYDYWLPGVNCDSIENIDLMGSSVFRILDSAGNETDTITEDTTPPLNTGSTTGYYAMVAAGTYILVENPVLRRWMGPIFERQRRYIKII